MPNWCATNYAVRGKEDELKKFVDIVNTLPMAHENNFGRLWLGNLVIFFGEDWEKIRCRGVIDPNPYSIACMCGPDVEDTATLEIDEDGILRFSIQSAWDRCDEVENLILKHFPSFEFFYASTDEFHNFNILHDPDDLLHHEVAEYCDRNGERKTFGKGHYDEFLKSLREDFPEFPIPEDADARYFNSDDFFADFSKWKDDNDELYPEVIVWEEV